MDCDSYHPFTRINYYFFYACAKCSHTYEVDSNWNIDIRPGKYFPI